MSPKEKALDKMKSGDISPEPFMIKIKIRTEKPDPEKYKLKKDGKVIDMKPPKIEKAMDKAKKFMEMI
jgi:hypothetical protein